VVCPLKSYGTCEIEEDNRTTVTEMKPHRKHNRAVVRHIGIGSGPKVPWIEKGAHLARANSDNVHSNGGCRVGRHHCSEEAATRPHSNM